MAVIVIIIVKIIVHLLIKFIVVVIIALDSFCNGCFFVARIDCDQFLAQCNKRNQSLLPSWYHRQDHHDDNDHHRFWLLMIMVMILLIAGKGMVLENGLFAYLAFFEPCLITLSLSLIHLTTDLCSSSWSSSPLWHWRGSSLHIWLNIIITITNIAINLRVNGKSEISLSISFLFFGE